MSFKSMYFHSMDVKNRLFIPAKFREELGENFILFKGAENCIYGYTLEEFEVISEQFKNVKNRDVQRAFFSQIIEASVDKQGRVTLSADCVEHAGLTKEAVILGAGRRIEIWALENYNNTSKSLFDLVDADEYVW